MDQGCRAWSGSDDEGTASQALTFRSKENLTILANVHWVASSNSTDAKPKAD